MKETVRKMAFVAAKENKNKQTLLIDDREITRSFAGSDQTTKSPQFWTALAGALPQSSGILPPGLLSVRQGGEYEQIVIQLPPSVSVTCWGRNEGQSHNVWSLAYPWRIIIGTYHKGLLLGARLFYSHRQVTHLRQPLYHANVPNLNCRGYGQNVAVGWLCLYPREVRPVDLADRCRYLVDRASGGEPFNDTNMLSTDGPRFYREMYKSRYPSEGQRRKFACLWNPKSWALKTEREGVDWTLDPDLWIPVMVADTDNQQAHLARGVPLTLGRAMYGQAKFYYRDASIPKLYDTVSRAQDWNDEHVAEIWKSLTVAFGRARNEEVTEVVIGDDNMLPFDDFVNTFEGVTPADGLACFYCGTHVGAHQVNYRDTNGSLWHKHCWDAHGTDFKFEVEEHTVTYPSFWC
jgi:hypothetical protein